VRANVLALLDAIDPEKIIKDFGTLAVILIVFAESGLFFGFFLPGDSLLILAGYFSSTGDLWPIYTLLPALFLAAFLGDQVGYLFGRKVGPSIFSRPDSRFFKQDNVDRAKTYFDKHGSKAIVMARFVPVVRTFTPIIAGVSDMHYRTFVMFNAIGAFLWAVGVTSVGYFFGERFEGALPFVIVAVVIISVVPMAFEIRKARIEAREHRAGAASDPVQP
jgi:membrane-associated protein